MASLLPVLALLVTPIGALAVGAWAFGRARSTP
ncbi:hypothetical protein EEDFHM_03309 [Methylorubrum populi]